MEFDYVLKLCVQAQKKPAVWGSEEASCLAHDGRQASARLPIEDRSFGVEQIACIVYICEMQS